MLKSLFQSGKSSSKKDQIEYLKKFESIVEQSHQAIFFTDLEGDIVYTNAKFADLTGYSPEEVIGKNPRFLKTEYTPPEFYELLWETIKRGEKWVGEFVNQRKDGSIFYVHAEILPIVAESGEVTHYVAFEEDITRLKELEYELDESNRQLKEQVEKLEQQEKHYQEQLHHDHLTNLYHRDYLYEILPREFLRAIRARKQLIILMIDVDHFNSLNQRFGYQIGNCVLKSIGKRITDTLGPFDLVFRTGGDAFVALISSNAEETGINQAQSIQDTLTTLAFDFENQIIHLTVSMGIAIYPIHGKTIDELITKVESALAISKESGGNKITLWS